MPLTSDQLLATSYGYLCGADLTKWCSPQLLTKQANVDPNSLQQAVDMAVTKVRNALINRYDSKKELALKAPVQGTAVATINAGAIQAIQVRDAGGKYTTPPTVTLVGGAGAGATAVAVLTDGVLTAINVTAAGAGYTSVPSVVLAGGLADDPREQSVLQITATLAVRNALGSSQNVSDFQMQMFKQAEKDLSDIRNGEYPVMLQPVPQQTNPEDPFPEKTRQYGYPESDNILVRSSFKFLG